jgi:26S proteasome regulatory subunit N1
MLYHLSLAMYPRILSTFDEDLNPLSVSVRVGQAVDVVGQAGTLWLSVVPVLCWLVV